MKYLHGAGLVHGDIKPQNVLVFPGEDGRYRVKICDFGFAEQVNADGLIPYRGMRGSLGYFAPEQLHRHDYGQAVDVFALGIMLYTLLCGYEPFFPSNRAGLLTGDPVQDAEVIRFDSPYWDAISEDGKEFILSLLHGDPGKRLTASQALSHPWLTMTTHESESKVASSEDGDIQFA